MHSCAKSNLAKCLEELSPSYHSEPPLIEAVILDGAAIVNMLKPEHCKTFQQYGEEVFLSYVQQYVKLHVNRIDIVWNAYNANNLKAHTREKRGNGLKRRVEPNSRTPTNWDGFLRVDENKKELFRFLSAMFSTADGFDKKVISSYDQSVVSKPNGDIGNLSPCTHEEADARIFGFSKRRQ